MDLGPPYLAGPSEQVLSKISCHSIAPGGFATVAHTFPSLCTRAHAHTHTRTGSNKDSRIPLLAAFPGHTVSSPVSRVQSNVKGLQLRVLRI